MPKLGYIQKPSHRRKVSMARLGTEFPEQVGLPCSPSKRNKCKIKAYGNKSRTGLTNSVESRLKQSQAMIGNQNPKGYQQSENHIKKKLENRMTPLSFAGHHQSQESKTLVSLQAKFRWGIPEVKSTLVQSMLNSVQASPNGSELRLLQIIHDYDLPFTYNTTQVIGRKIPDFIATNGQKLLIELYGDYWHQNENEQIRLNHFKSYGYETLILWESELNNLPEDTIAGLLINLTKKGVIN